MIHDCDEADAPRLWCGPRRTAAQYRHDYPTWAVWTSRGLLSITRIGGSLQLHTVAAGAAVSLDPSNLHDRPTDWSISDLRRLLCFLAGVSSC